MAIYMSCVCACVCVKGANLVCVFFLSYKIMVGCKNLDCGFILVRELTSKEDGYSIA